MRQSGILAAAGLYALEHNVKRLKDDHDNAAWLAQQLKAIGVDVSRQDTNMVFLRLQEDQVIPLKNWMAEKDIKLSTGPVTRLVTHLDVDRPALETLVTEWRAFLAASQ